MLKKILLSFILSTAGAACVQVAAAPTYALDGTEVRAIHARGLQRDYEVFVSLPDNYATSSHRYPVLFVTDANYGFPLIRSIARRVGNHGKRIEDFILVGLSYGKGDTPEYSRRRDYTPTRRAGMASDMPGREAKFGEAEGYRHFLADEVFPLIEANYRADMRRKVFVGHSYGSLLGVDILLNAPTMFDHYILGSPSLWFDNKVMFKREKIFAAAHKDLPANIYFAAGAFETIRPGTNNPRYLANDDDDMLRDLRTFTAALASRHYPSLHVKTEVIADEDHLTVFPAIITRGLQWALPPKPAPH